MMAVRIIAKVGKNKVTLKREDWDEMQRRLALAVGDEPLSARGGCRSMCDEACESAGGCDFTFGEPPECGGFCNNGEPWLQEV
jgi:nitrate reductase beta subunit